MFMLTTHAISCPLLPREYNLLVEFWSDCILMLCLHRGSYSLRCFQCSHVIFFFFFLWTASPFLPSSPLPLVSLSWRHYWWSQRDRPSLGSQEHRLQLFWCQCLLSAPISTSLLYLPLLPRTCPYSGHAHLLYTGGGGPEWMWAD